MHDWETMELSRFQQPPKPVAPAGLNALEQLVKRPEAARENTLLLTREFVVAYDLYPKAQVHLLILPRDTALHGPSSLKGHHAPLLRRMQSLAKWLSLRLAEQMPSLSPMLAGFHSVPSMRQLHLHLISLDFASEALKNKKHWNSFATDFFVPPAQWAAELESAGRVARAADPATEAKLKQEMCCPLTGTPLKNIPAVKNWVASEAYRAAISRLSREELDPAVAMRWPLR